MKKSYWALLSWVFFGILLTACADQTATLTQVPPSPAVQTTPLPTLTLTSTSTPLPTETLTPTVEPVSGACSPLGGIGLNELYAITSNPFNPGSAFSDTGHPAVDLAFFTFKNFSTMRGLPVQSLLPGKVVVVVSNRFPYGNMIMIETPLSSLSPDLLKVIPIPTPIPEENIELFSTCSKDMLPIDWSEGIKSIYILYSHLETKPEFKAGDLIACGQQIGAVGISGNSIAEHLHLEMRIGPSSARFGTISMYTEDATPEERYNYCIWSISGRFQAVDPSSFWKHQP